MKEFDKNKIYRIGVLKTTSDNYEPEFSTRPKPISVNGLQLHKANCKDWNKYLIENPHNWPTDKIIHCYEIGEGGEMNYFGEGNAMQNSNQPTTVDDNGKTIVFPNQRGSQEDIDFFKRQVNKYQNEIDKLNAKIEAERTDYFDQKSKWLEEKHALERERETWKTKYEALEKMVEGWKEGNALNDDAKGTAAKIMEFLNGPFGNLIFSLGANNPEVQKILSNFIIKAGKNAGLDGDENNNGLSQGGQQQPENNNNQGQSSGLENVDQGVDQL